jgi:hypothetical protein
MGPKPSWSAHDVACVNALRRSLELFHQEMDNNSNAVHFLKMLHDWIERWFKQADGIEKRKTSLRNLCALPFRSSDGSDDDDDMMMMRKQMQEYKLKQSVKRARTATQDALGKWRFLVKTKFKDRLKNNCAICRCSMNRSNAVMCLRPCGHLFDAACWTSYKHANTTKAALRCPECKAFVQQALIVDNDNSGRSSSGSSSSSSQESSQAVTPAVSRALLHKLSSSSPAVAASAAVDERLQHVLRHSTKQLVVQLQSQALAGKNELGTKCEQICKWIRFLSHCDPTAQFVVFSMHPLLLDYIAYALRRNKISCKRLQGDTESRGHVLDSFAASSSSSAPKKKKKMMMMMMLGDDDEEEEEEASSP